MVRTEKRRTGIVLRLTPFKDSDAMVNAISEDGFFSFKARGVEKLSSKNAPSVQPLTLSEFILMESQSGGLSLKEGGVIESFSKIEDLSCAATLSFIQELTLKIVQEDEALRVYPYLLASLRLISSGNDPLSVGLLYFAKVLTIGGYGLNVDRCVICGKQKDIVCLSYSEGGFLCRDDFEAETSIKTSPRHLQIARFLFKCEEKDFPRGEFAKEECLLFYSELSQYLENLTGVKLKSISLLKKF